VEKSNNPIRYTFEVIPNSPQEEDVLKLTKQTKFQGCVTQYLFSYVDHVVTIGEQIDQQYSAQVIHKKKH